MSTLKELRDIRIDKLNNLKKLGIDPYTAINKKNVNNIDLSEKFEEFDNKYVVVAGRIMAIRSHGKLAFIDVHDESGKVQLYIKEDSMSQPDYKSNEIGFSDLDLLDVGDFIEGHGTITKTTRGEISVAIKIIRVLSKSLRPIPDILQDTETRYRQRYVDMIVNPEVKKTMETRSVIVQTIRESLMKHGFLEVETPVLQPIYGGASAKPFITKHNALDSTYYLRISNELYLKRLIVGGFEKVFEFSRDFRNEGIDRSHNPEFTMLEFYWAYADYNDLMNLTEEILREVIMRVKGSLKFEYQGEMLDFTAPYKRITFRNIILEKTGVDVDKVTREELINEIKTRKLDIDMKKNPPMKDLLDEFYKETCRKYIIQPFFLLDYPAEMIPLAKKKFDNPSKIASMQLVCMGFEIIKAYNELNDPIDQFERMSKEQTAIDTGATEEAQPIDLDFIKALEIGMPPTAGWGMGIDRLCAFLLDQHTLKDVIIFPTLKPEQNKTTKDILEED